ncbi:MAG: ABC transporter substrate-binding protein [Nitrospirota bacterium]
MPLRKAVLFFIFLLIPAYLCVPAASAAQKTIGVVFSGDLPRYQEANKAFMAALARAGFGQGKVSVYVQTPNPDPMSWTNSVRKFIGIEADVIVAYGAGAATTAVRETGKIPIVFAYVYDPAACGMKSRNSTGISSKVPMVTLLRTMKSIKPFARLAVVYNPYEKDSVVQFNEVIKNAPLLRFSPVGVQVKSSQAARSMVQKTAADCVYVSCSAAVDKDVSGIIAASNKKKIPVIAQVSGVAEKGGLLALAPSPSEQGEAAAMMVARILKGVPVSRIGMETARKINLVLNLKAANTLSIKVPFDVLNAATKVIK